MIAWGYLYVVVTPGRVGVITLVSGKLLDGCPATAAYLCSTYSLIFLLEAAPAVVDLQPSRIVARFAWTIFHVIRYNSIFDRDVDGN